MVPMLGSLVNSSVASCAKRRFKIVGLRYPTSVAAAACSPGELVKISSVYPSAKPNKVVAILLVPNGSQRIKMKYK
jgi:hypothetical protein